MFPFAAAATATFPIFMQGASSRLFRQDFAKNSTLTIVIIKENLYIEKSVSLQAIRFLITEFLHAFAAPAKDLSYF